MPPTRQTRPARTEHYHQEARATDEFASRIDSKRDAQIDHGHGNIGRFAWTEYSALIVVDVSPEHRVNRVRVLRVGVGLQGRP
jgi:hypothetical protein